MKKLALVLGFLSFAGISLSASYEFFGFFAVLCFSIAMFLLILIGVDAIGARLLGDYAEEQNEKLVKKAVQEKAEQTLKQKELEQIKRRETEQIERAVLSKNIQNQIMHIKKELGRKLVLEYMEQLREGMLSKSKIDRYDIFVKDARPDELLYFFNKKVLPALEKHDALEDFRKQLLSIEAVESSFGFDEVKDEWLQLFPDSDFLKHETENENRNDVDAGPSDKRESFFDPDDFEDEEPDPDWASDLYEEDLKSRGDW